MNPSHNGIRPTAKMAEIARRLPKWQPQQILCQIKINFCGMVFAVEKPYDLFSLTSKVSDARLPI